MGQVYYSSDWSSQISCHGSPTSMYIIDANDVGPPSFQWAISQVTPGFCGYNTLPLEKGCCMGSYDLASSIAASVMISSSPVDQTSDSFVAWTPTTAIGSNYCTATYTSLGGYSITKYLLDDGICRESWLCDKGILKVSNATGVCMGDYQETIADAKFSDVLNSTVSFAYTKIEKAEQPNIWNGFYPFSKNIIYLNTGGRDFAFIVILLGMSTSIAGNIYIARQIQLHPNRKRIYLPSVVSQTVALAGSIVIIVFFFFTQTGETEFLVLNTLSTLLQALASFLVIFYNIKSLLYIFKGTKHTAFIEGKENIFFGGMLFVHLALIWPWYVSWLGFEIPVIGTWYGYGTIWIGLSLLGNVMSLVALIYYQLTKGSEGAYLTFFENMKELVVNNTSSFVLLLLLIFNFLWFIVCYVLVNTGFSLQNDIEYQIVQVFQWLPIPIDGLIYVWLFDKVGAMKRAQATTSSKS